MAATSSENFYSLLERSGLLTIDELDAVRKSTAELTDPRAVARQLIADECLTRWQAAQLLAGGSKLSLGKYRLLDQIGSSPTGKVYLATNPKLDRKVAIKAINRRKATDPEQLKRFQQEARSVALLDHRNIVHAYDVDREGNLDMIVMEHVDGKDLKQMIAEGGRLSAWQAANFVYQAALGLAHAHERGVTHGDLKPSNLLVDSHGVLKIVDMGVARFSQENGDEAAGRTAISYLSPEQVRGAQGSEPASDLYSLGSTFYHLLAGQPPFAETTDLRELLKQQVDGAKPLAEVRSDVPAELIAICERLMASDASQRYGSAGEVAAELKAWLDTHSPEESSGDDSSAYSEFAIDAEPPRWSASGSHKSLPVETAARPTPQTDRPSPAAARPVPSTARPAPLSADEAEETEAGGRMSRGKLIGLCSAACVAVLAIGVGAYSLLRPGDDPSPAEDTTAQAADGTGDEAKANQEKKGVQADGAGKQAKDQGYQPAANEIVWVNDDTPKGAIGTGSENFASWRWESGKDHHVHSDKFAALRKSQQAEQPLSEHRFEGATKTLDIVEHDKLFAYVWLDPKDTPEMIMLEWNDGSPEHRAFWGADKATVGTLDTPSRRAMGPLPEAGKWARLEVRAADVGLAAGAKVSGMAFIQFGGTAYWDTIGLAHSDGSAEPEKPAPKSVDVAKPEPKPETKPETNAEPPPRPKLADEPPKDATLVLAQSHPVEIVKATADKGVELVEQPDGSLRARGPNANDVTYELVVKTNLPRITGFKLECLADEPLPAKGPGRHKNGMFIIGEIEAFSSDSADLKTLQSVEINDVLADFEAPKWEAKLAIDGKRETGWSMVGKPGEDRWLLATFKTPLNDVAPGAGDNTSSDVWLKLVIRHFAKNNAAVGCFRVRALTGRETSGEFASLPKFPDPPDPFAALPEQMSLPPLGEGGDTEPLDLGALVLSNPALANMQLLGGDNAISGREGFSLDENQTSDHPEWQVKLGAEGAGTNIAQFTVREGKLWFRWLAAAATKRGAENFRNCLLVLTGDGAEHRITLRQPTEVDPLSISPAGGKKLISTFKIPSAPDSDAIRWELVELDKSLAEGTANPDPPYDFKQRVQIGLGGAGTSDVALVITPSSGKLQVAHYFRVADAQKPQRLIATSLKRMSGQIAGRRLLLQNQKKQIEAVTDGELKKRLQPQLDQIVKDLAGLDTMTARLNGVGEKATLLDTAAPLQFRIFYEIDADTQIDLVRATATGAAE